MKPIASTAEVNALIAANAPVAIGVSGGKDSSAVAVATIDHLDRIGHTGPRVLIHSDLGATEWKQSLPTCESLAAKLGMELIVVRRAKGDMMDRWEQRWSDNCNRYINLECVKLILPWSTPEMRFCTSELKVAPICQELVKRFPQSTILSVSGIRREESSDRKKAPIAKPQPKLSRATLGTSGLDWHPIIEWSLSDVLELLEERGIPLHEAYTTYGLSRVSCAFCIMQNDRDRLAATACRDNHPLFRRMTNLESESTFAFQGEKWLADTAPHLLTAAQFGAVVRAKKRAAVRRDAESWLPKHLLYTKGWPTCIPSFDEAVRLSEMRQAVSQAVGIEVNYVTPASVIDRYSELYEAKHGQAV